MGVDTNNLWQFKNTIMLNVYVTSLFLLCKVLLVASLLEGADVSSACNWPGGVAFGSECYVYIARSQTWAEPQAVCLAMGGFLAEVVNDGQNKKIHEIKTSHGNRGGIWLGGEDLIIEGRWFWTTSGVEISNDFYEDFDKDQPDNRRGENCLEMREVSKYGRSWNDVDCETYASFVCQKHVTSYVTSSSVVG